MMEKLRAAAPEFFEGHPMPGRRTFGWVSEKSIHYKETKAFLEGLNVEIRKGLGAVPFPELLEAPATPMWAHDGKCQCGKRCYLFGQCTDCLRNERMREFMEKTLGAEEEWQKEQTKSEQPKT